MGDLGKSKRFELCVMEDDNGVFLRLYKFTSIGTPDGITDLDLAGDPYVPIGTISKYCCPVGGAGSDTFAKIEVDGVLQSTDAPIFDFDSSDFLLTESPVDSFDITVKDSGIDHDQTTNFVANEHIDWTQSGAGTIHATNYIDNDTLADYDDGGDSVVADRILGAISNHAQSFITNNITRLKIFADGLVKVINNKSGWSMIIENSKPDGGGEGLLICAGEIQNDSSFRIQDANKTFDIMDVHADDGEVTLGKTFVDTVADNGTAYGVDNQHDAGQDNTDFNTQNGAYRIGGSLPYNEASATSSTSTTSTSYVVVNAMTITPGVGTYIASFSASGRGQQDNQQMQIALFNNGTKVGHTERDYGYEADSLNEDKRFGVHTQAIITVADSQAIDVRYLTNTSAFNIFERSLILTKVKAD